MNIKFKNKKAADFSTLPMGTTFRDGPENQYLLMKIPEVNLNSTNTITYNAINLNTGNLCHIYVNRLVSTVNGSWIEE